MLVVENDRHHPAGRREGQPVGIAAETTLPTMRVNYFIREAFAAAYMQLAGTLY